MAAINLPPSLEYARIHDLPSTAYYIPDFISEDEECSILSKVRSSRHRHRPRRIRPCARLPGIPSDPWLTVLALRSP